MAIYTKLVPLVPDANLTSTILASTATTVTLSLTDGTTLVLTGTGFVVTGGQMTAGTINSATHKDAGLTDVETWTGFNYSAVTFQSFLTPVFDDKGLGASLFGGNDTWTGNSLGDDLNGAVDLATNHCRGFHLHPPQVGFKVALRRQVHRLDDVEVDKLDARHAHGRQLQRHLSAHRADANDGGRTFGQCFWWQN